ncbi:MAG: DUF86 domain-containing protein [Methanotrichaceae archaeon]
MDVNRIKRYKDKANIILKRGDQIKMWALDIPSDQFLSDDKAKLASYKAFQEMIEAAMDIVAMMCRDSGIVPKDDYLNVENLELEPQIREALLEANGLRNRLVHRYNRTDDRIALESTRALLPEMESFAKEAEAWVLKRSS